MQRRLPRAILAIALLVSPALTHAQMPTGAPGTAPGIGMRVRSWVEIPFRSTVRQQFDFSCGSAAVATLLTFQYATPTSEADAFTAMWNKGDQTKIRGKGFSLLDMKNYLVGRGFQAQGFRLAVSDMRGLGLPMIALVTVKGYTHFVVVKGARDGRVLIGDPARGMFAMSDEDFTKIWSGIALIVIAPPARLIGRFNQASEWAPWTAPPTDSVIVPRTAGNITDNLPPIYQLQIQVLPTIPVGGLG